MKKYLIIITMLLLTNISYAEESIKPSFDCTKAKSEVEKLICSDNELAKLDIEMNTAYNKFKATLDKDWQKKLKQKQNRWLKNRSEIYCMKDKIVKPFESTEIEKPITKNTCLIRAYKHRIKKLNSWASRDNYDFFIDATRFLNQPVHNEGSAGGAVGMLTIIDAYGEELYFKPILWGSFGDILRGEVFKKPDDYKLNIYFDSSNAFDANGNNFYSAPEVFSYKDGVLNVFYTGPHYDDINDEYKKGHTDNLDISYALKKFPTKDEYLNVSNNILDTKLPKKNLSNKPEPEFCKGILEKVKGQSLRKWINEKFKTDDIKIIYPKYIAYSKEELKDIIGSDFKCDLDKIDKTTYPVYTVYDYKDDWIFAGKYYSWIDSQYYIFDKNNCKFKNYFDGDFYSSIAVGGKPYYVGVEDEDLYIKDVSNNEYCSFRYKEKK